MRTTSALGFCWAFSLLAACGAKNPVVDVQVVDRGGAFRGGQVSQDHVSDEAKKMVERWPGFVLRAAKKDEASWQLTVQLDILVQRAAENLVAGTGTAALPSLARGEGVVKPGDVERIAGATLRLSRIGVPSKAPAPNEPVRYEGTGLLRRVVAPSESPELLVLAAIRDAADDIASSMRLSTASDDALVEALANGDRATRSRAVTMSADRKLKAAVPGLIEILKNEDEEQELVLKAIGALVAIRDERAVGALIDAGRKRSAAYLGQILFAVGELGGKEAEAYLFTVSTGHPDEEVKKAAKQALEELERRKERKSETK